MVVFTCNHCGESLQKPRVEKHYQTTCKNPIAVTCMDCFKDFKMQEYASHVKCVTEEERYSAKGTVQNPKKGEMKQSSWIETVNSIIEKEKNAKPEVRKMLETLSKHSNVPRKKNKFVNFITNALGGNAKPEDIDAVWELLESHKPAVPEKNKEGKLGNAKFNKKRKSQMTADDNTENPSPQKKKKGNKPKEEGDLTDAAAGAETDPKTPKKKKADKKSEDKNLSESDATATTEKSKSAKRKKRKLGKEGEAEEETSESQENAPATNAASTAAAQNGDVPKKKKKTTTPAADSQADGAKKESPKKKKNPQQQQSAANPNQNADAPKKNKKKPVGQDVEKKNDAAGDDKTSAKKNKKPKSKSLSNGVQAADESSKDKKGAEGAKKKEKKEADKTPKRDWEESVKSIVKGKPSGITKNDLMEQLFQKYAADGEEIHNKVKLRKHIIKLLYKMPELKVDKDIISLAN